MLYVILSVILGVGFFAAAYNVWLLVKLRMNRSQILDRNEFEWLFKHEPMDLRDDDVDIEVVKFLEDDFESEVKKVGKEG